MFAEPGRVSGMRLTKLTSTAAQISWDRLPCREHNGNAVGYMYELRRYVQSSGHAVDVVFGIVNNTSVDLSRLIPFANYTVSLRFANHLYQGPHSTLDFITFEDCEYHTSAGWVYHGTCCTENYFNPLTLTVVMGAAIKHPVPDRLKPSFVIFDIRAFWRSGLSVRVPECQTVQITD